MGVKADMVKLKDMFMSNNLRSRTVQDNWNLFKSSLLDSVSKHVPQKSIKSRCDLPWLNHEIKKSMRHRKRLYNIAKQSGKSEDWAAYRSARNSVNSQLECAHNAYYGQLFDDYFAGNRRQFWKYIQARRKEPSGVSTLLIDNQSVSDHKEKAITLSNQFQSVFTREDLSNVPVLEANTCIQAGHALHFI